MGGSVAGMLDFRPRAGRGGDNAAVVTCCSMASSNFSSAAMLDISRKVTNVKERVDCIDRLHFSTQNPRLSSYNLCRTCALAVW